MSIHPSAIIHAGAQVDPSAEIGPYSIIGPDTVIGPGCQIGPHCVVEYTAMGRGNRLLAGCYVGTPPQDVKYAGEPTRLIMGDGNLVREGVTLNRGTTATRETRIGSGCLFMALSHVAHDCRVGNGVILVNGVGLAGHVTIGDNAVMGGMSGVHQFVRIGRLCMISGGSMLGKDIPPFCTAQGDRAGLRGLNTIGLRRAGFTPATIRAIRTAYVTLFNQGLRLEEAVAKLRASNPIREVGEMLDFISSGKRGIMRPKRAVRSEEGVEA
ncbi:MAG TPA: acyl-[acyl-carrier-protein]--UDP-N-acetylglucosamine O-acyltransferase [Elusimicrobia bacterium]|nr:acyl-[acyl-carrier-protein]--UDP-N-acetylglucosamine O-acyltransferase [Elusimicrobiota bacterium]HBT61893.1 acyl-[acyl-carrier-protein]--UDP-N-acetylglucosamine O-acyltransferase [Elusimicrobiota bacterium]